MKVLVAAASKHGGTWGIAQAIDEALAAQGLTTSLFGLVPDVDYPDPSGYDAIVIGSAVYAGHWMPPARRFISGYQKVLRSRPVWLFSSGPVGIVPRPSAADSVNVDTFMRQTSAREHRLFGGRIDRSRLGFAERALIGALGVGDGDNRDFEEIREWAASIGAHVNRDRALAP